MRIAVVALSLAVLLPACQRDPPPDATYRALVRAMADRDEDAAWALLSEGTRARLEERARVAAAAAAPGVLVPGARAVLAGDAPLAVRPPSAITVLRADAGRAVLRVEAPGAPAAEVVLLRERGGWRVELPVQ